MRSRKVLALAAAAIAVAAGVAVYIAVRPGGDAFGRLARGRRFNVILVTLDTVRADALGCYGRRDIETPTVDGFAARGVRFENAIAQTPLTLASHTTLMTGTQPLFHGVRDNGAFVVPPKMLTMAELFKDKGYATGAFIGAYVLDSQWGLDQGFDVYYDRFDLRKFGRISLESVERPASEVLDAALPWLEEQKGQAFFAWIHLYDAHAPYEPPAPFDRRYAGLPYLGEIAFADAELGRLRRFLDGNGLTDSTFVIIAGDHGESLGEHGETTHGFFVYQPAIRVPLIVATPFRELWGRVTAEPAGLVDVLPTVCRMAGLPVPAEAQGRSLVPALFGRRSRKAPLNYSETFYPRFHFGWSELRSVQDARYKLIIAPRPELYDLAADPLEARDLAAERPDIVRRLSAEAEVFGRRASRGAYRMEMAKVDAASRERLAALGYVGSSPDQAKLKGRALADPKDKIGVYNDLARAREMARAGRGGEAVDLIRAIVAADPDITEAYFALGSILLEEKRLPEGIEAFRRVLERKPDEGFAALNIVWAYQQLDQPGEAERFAREYLDQGFEEPHLYAVLGEMKFGRKAYDEAIPYLEKAVALEAEPAGSCDALATIWIAKGDLAKASEYLAKLVALDPRAPNVHYRIGWVAEKQGRLQDAEAAYRAELGISPKHFQALYNLSRVYDRTGRLEQERETLEKCLEADPRFAPTYFYLARLDLVRNERPEEAFELVRKGLAFASDPADQAAGYLLLSDLYRRAGDDARSREYAAKGQALAEAAKKRP